MKQTKSILPLDLQFFAEEGTDPGGDGGQESGAGVANDETPEGKTDDDKSKPNGPADVQELMKELAKARRAADKASSEAAEFKKLYKTTLSEKEQYDMDKAEAEAKRNEEFESMRSELETMKLREQFVSLGYSLEQAATAAKAQYENDVETLLKVQQQFMKDKIESEKQKILSELPQPQIGTGGSQQYTKEDFDEMSLIERTKLKRENEAEYNRLLKL